MVVQVMMVVHQHHLPLDRHSPDQAEISTHPVDIDR
jgi:hypothetical protein